jgi:hypothetical protein
VPRAPKILSALLALNSEVNVFFDGTANATT